MSPLYSDIHSQPPILETAIQVNRESVERIAQAVSGIGAVFIAARGTSDNAARYAQYLWGMFNRLPVILAAPSMFSLYRQPPELKDVLVVGISQSGQSPDILEVLLEGKRQGRLTLAITNAPNSPLAEAADFVLNIRAGEEKAVAATKTYTAQLLSIAMLSAAMQADQEQWNKIAQLPNWVAEALEGDAYIAGIAPRYRYMQHCAVLGRGYNYATAFEWALKLKELSYVIAEPYSPADFQHGPIAMVADGFPVLAIAPGGGVYQNIVDLLEQLKSVHRAELLVISDQEQALNLATSPIRLPSGIPEWLSPLVSIVPAQIFSYYLTQAKNYDTEHPRGLRKVTLTR
jgi:glucosamine--fructose-6-phosphate aminotransferase (isomerizing)